MTKALFRRYLNKPRQGATFKRQIPLHDPYVLKAKRKYKRYLHIVLIAFLFFIAIPWIIWLS